MAAPTAERANELDKVTERLIRLSEERASPAFGRLRFPDRLDSTRPVMPEPLLSLAGHRLLVELDSESRWRLGLLETVNFFSLNIHGEQALVAELAQSLYRGRWPGDSSTVSRYLQHFIHEENSHTYMLAEFCTRYHGRVLAETVYRFENPTLSRLGKDLLFLSRAYVLETFLDLINRAAMHDNELEPTARAVHRSHHLDEARHIAFDTAVIAALIIQMKREGLEDDVRQVALLSQRYADYAFSRLVNPWIYRELGLDDPIGLAQEVQASTPWLARKQRCRESQQRFFLTVGLVAPAE